MPGILGRIRKNRQESGQTLVEFALVLIFVILPVTMIFIEASVILYKYVALNNAAREGAHAASIYLYWGDPGGSSSAPDAGRRADVLQAVSDTVGPLIPPPPDCNNTSATTTCQITYGPGSAPPPFTDPLRSTDALTVSLRHTHAFLFGALGNQLDLRARSTMRIEPSAVISGTGP